MSTKAPQLTEAEIMAILRASDEIIMVGGRTLLAKILKGSREKKILQLELDECPAYGYFNDFTIAQITEKIDWMIDHDFLETAYSGKLPMIVFTERGWKIEANQRADELLFEWETYITKNVASPDMNYLKDRNREMFFLFIEKINVTGEQRYIPYLEAWEKIDYKKVKAKIRETVEALQTSKPVDQEFIITRNLAINEALQGQEPQDLLIKCWECGDRFVFTVGEQKFFKQKGFVLPRRCQNCRDKERYYL
ncbi:superfamily II DNA helicase [Aquibacillus halophilus]|uniref:Superfamily II DNA helicase n=1 Tax=Aquibacillus halophilus TaxID=930132 RepID=A0A6A8D627_9BACI|nr:RQC-minor-1 family DNA-binding protein [Aquibacillus halophilus]MRH41183.1 superfamily II DNA helicase [Aquibacillus halophilus]